MWKKFCPHDQQNFFNSLKKPELMMAFEEYYENADEIDINKALSKGFKYYF